MSVAEIEPIMVDDTASAIEMGVTITARPVATNNDHGDIDPSQRWRALEKLVSRPSPFGEETGQLALGEFEPFGNVSSGREEARGEGVVWLSRRRESGAG